MCPVFVIMMCLASQEVKAEYQSRLNRGEGWVRLLDVLRYLCRLVGLSIRVLPIEAFRHRLLLVPLKGEEIALSWEGKTLDTVQAGVLLVGELLEVQVDRQTLDHPQWKRFGTLPYLFHSSSANGQST